MELSFEGEGYNLYSVPILLNGEQYHLQVAYDFTTEEWSILGARQGIEDNGMADKEMRDAMGNYAYSNQVTFDCEGGDIYTTVY